MAQRREKRSEWASNRLYEMIVYEKQYEPGSKLPNENEMSAALEVSRTTLREAVSFLVAQGVLEIRRGKGTFVKNTGKINQNLSKLTSFSEDMRTRGMVPGAKILLLDVLMANEVVADKLGIPVGDDVSCFGDFVWRTGSRSPSRPPI